MDMENIWKTIIKDLTDNPRDIPTAVKPPRKPLYFHASTNGKAVFINNAVLNVPSVNLSSKRRISEKDFYKMYPLYLKRENGESIAKEIEEVGEAKKNQSYTFGIIKAIVRR